MAAKSPEHAAQDLGRPRWDVLAVIALGGMIGATARREVAVLLPVEPGHFPWATLWTNLSGSFVLGFVVIVAMQRLRRTRYALPFVATGILGAYTTMATYIIQSVLLLRDGHIAAAVTYVFGSVVFGVACAYAGVWLARRFATARR